MRKSRYAGIAVLLVLLLCVTACSAGTQMAPQDTNITSEPAVETGGPLGYTVISGRGEEATPAPAQVEEIPDEVPEETPAPVSADSAEEAVRTLLESMSLEERVAQMFLAGCPASGAAEALEQYPVGGYILFASNISQLDAEGVRTWLQTVQSASRIPLLIAVDEEGGTVVRVSSNPALRETRFPSPRSLYEAGGMERVLEDAEEKSDLLLSLGINVNLAPVCDVTADPDSFMYKRSISGDSTVVSDYVSRVTASMTERGIGWVMKHFPGYGECGDTHEEVIRDPSEESAFQERYLPPFMAGAATGNGAVMVCHNIVEAYDSALPASLSPAVHQLLREKLGDEIVVITDDLDMKGITGYTDGNEAVLQAILAGNDMLLTSYFQKNIDTVVDAVRIGTIPETQINDSVARILRWKYSLGLLGAESTGGEE